MNPGPELGLPVAEFLFCFLGSCWHLTSLPPSYFMGEFSPSMYGQNSLLGPRSSEWHYISLASNQVSFPCILSMGHPGNRPLPAQVQACQIHIALWNSTFFRAVFPLSSLVLPLVPWFLYQLRLRAVGPISVQLESYVDPRCRS